MCSQPILTVEFSNICRSRPTLVARTPRPRMTTSRWLAWPHNVFPISSCHIADYSLDRHWWQGRRTQTDVLELSCLVWSSRHRWWQGRLQELNSTSRPSQGNAATCVMLDRHVLAPAIRSSSDELRITTNHQGSKSLGEQLECLCRDTYIKAFAG